MSIFPTRILLATDGSSEARLAARTAVDLAQKTDSELHAIHVVDAASSVALLYPAATEPERVESVALLYPDATDPDRVQQAAPAWKEDLERHLEQGAGRYSTRKSNGYGRPVGPSHGRI